MPIQNINNVKTGDKVSYEDMANLYQEYTVVATPDDIINEWGYKEFRLRDENGNHRTAIFGQHGWNHYPTVLAK